MLSEQAQTVLSVLQTAHIEYHVKEHIPVYTIDEMSALHLPDGEAVAKNLFIRDDKKRTYYIVVIRQEKTANLKALRQTLGSRPLSFASEDDLWKYLKLTKGAITPLGALNDENTVGCHRLRQRLYGKPNRRPSQRQQGLGLDADE